MSKKTSPYEIEKKRSHFKIYGGYEIKLPSSKFVTQKLTDNFWKDGKESLKNEHGIYIFYRKYARKYNPIYVGKTNGKKGFEQEVFSADKLIKYNNGTHTTDKRYDAISGKYYFLFLVLHKRELKSKKKATLHKFNIRDISLLEREMIRQAFIKNPGIQNVKDAKASIPNWQIDDLVGVGRESKKERLYHSILKTLLILFLSYSVITCASPVFSQNRPIDDSLIEASRSYANLLLVKQLLKRGAKVNAIDEYGCNALAFASSNGDIFRTNSNDTSLAMMKVLINAGADVNSECFGKNILISLCSFAHLMGPRHEDTLFYNTTIKKIELLLRHHAKMNELDPDGLTALMNACHYNSIEAVQLLLNAGADVSVKSNKGNSAITFTKSQTIMDLINNKTPKKRNSIVVPKKSNEADVLTVINNTDEDTPLDNSNVSQKFIELAFKNPDRFKGITFTIFMVPSRNLNTQMMFTEDNDSWISYEWDRRLGAGMGEDFVVTIPFSTSFSGTQVIKAKIKFIGVIDNRWCHFEVLSFHGYN